MENTMFIAAACWIYLTCRTLILDHITVAFPLTAQMMFNTTASDLFFEVRTVNKNNVNIIGTLRSHDGDGNEKFKKAIALISKTTILHVITLFCTFLCRHCTTTTWKFLISRFTGEVHKRQRNFLSLSEVGYVLRDLILGGFTYIWQSWWLGVIATKIERTWIHFFRDGLSAVAVLGS